MTQFNRGLKGLKKEHFSESDIFHLHVKYHQYHNGMHNGVIYFKPNDTTPYVQLNGVELTLATLIGMGLYQGVINCGANPNYPAASEGEYWRVSVAGLIGGAGGVAVEVGDQIICIASNAGGTEAQVGTSFMLIQKNMVACDIATLRTGTDNLAFVTANVLANAFNGGNAFTSSGIPLVLSAGSTAQLAIGGSGTANGIDFVGAPTTGSLVEYTGIGTKTSGYLFNGRMSTSVLDGSTIIDDFSQECAHDGIHSDTLIGKRIVWSGNVPNGTLASSLAIQYIEFTGIFGTGQNKGGDIAGLDINMQGTINDASALEYGLKVSVSTTRTGAGSVFGAYIYTNATATAAAYISNTTIGIHLATGNEAIEISGTVTDVINLTSMATITNIMKFDSIAGGVIANALVPAAAPDAGTVGADACLRVLIGATPYYIPLYDTLHA